MSISNQGALLKAKLDSSGILPTTAKRLRLELLSSLALKAKLPTAQPVASLLIPYWDARGKPTEFFRVRYLEPLPGFASAVAKPQRYIQPPGTVNEVYLPPLFAKHWEVILADANTPLYITEGELKAACACQAGLATMGLGGVEVWRSSRAGLPMLPTLETTNWAQREVFVVYDSDLATNPNVLRAQNQLCSALVQRGAKPRIVALPNTPDGQKQGLDDYLVANGKENFELLAQSAVNLSEAQALWGMNESVVNIRHPAMVLEQGTGAIMSANTFLYHTYANRKHTVFRTTATGAPTSKVVSTAKEWLEWPQRYELNGVTYAPGLPSVTPNRLWNSWRGWGLEPKAGDLKPWHWLMEFVFKGQHASRKWFEQWLAYPLQHPGTKLFSAAVIWGVAHGSGKTLIGHTMLRIYGTNGKEVKSDNLKKGFNSWAKDTQFVLGDEITGSDKRAEADTLKGMITQQQLTINIKYQPEYTVPDCVNYFFTSNHPDAFFLEDDDRRMFVHELAGSPASREKYEWYDKWYKGSGAAALFHYLLALPTEDFNPRAEALQTTAKQAMIADNKSELGAWVAGLKDSAEAQLVWCGHRAAKDCALFSSDQLRQCLDPEHTRNITANAVGRELKRAGFAQVNRGGPVRTAGGLMRLFAIRSVADWVAAEHEQCAQHWDKFFAPSAKKF